MTNTCTHSHAHRDRENKSDIKEVGGLSLVILTKKGVKNHKTEKCYGGNFITISVL